MYARGRCPGSFGLRWRSIEMGEGLDRFGT